MNKLKTIVIRSLVLSYLLFLSFEVSADSSHSEKLPLFTFVQITDTHCLKTDKKPGIPPAKALIKIGGYKLHWKDIVNSLPILENTIKYINQKIKPDFLIHTGDLTERGDLSNLRKVKELLDRLNCPYYPVMGDHDLGGYSYSNFDRSDCNYIKVFGQRCYSFNYRDWHIVVLGIYPNEGELSWFKEDLSKNAERPVILATHRLVIADKFTCWLGKKYSGCSMVMPKAKKVINILRNYQSVKMVLSGHCHSNFRWDKYGIVFISTAALLEVPHQFKLFQVYPDRIKISLFSANRAEDVLESSFASWELRPINLKDKR